MKLKSYFGLLLLLSFLINIQLIVAVGECKFSKEGFSALTQQEDKEKSCDASISCFKVIEDSGKLSFEGVEGAAYNLRKGSIVKCNSKGELLPGTEIEFGAKGLSSSYSVDLVKNNGILLDGVTPGDRLDLYGNNVAIFTKNQDNIKNVGELGRKDLQVTPVTVCGQKIDAPIGKKSEFGINQADKKNCKVTGYLIYGAELSKDVQSSSYKCFGRDLKLNGVAVVKDYYFKCDNKKGDIECNAPGCFENIAGYYNLDIDGIKFQNLKGFISYKYENTGIYKIEGSDVIADFKGANVHCNTDECYFFKGSLVYKPKSGLGIRKTGGLEIGLPGLKMFEIKPQVSDPTKTSSTGCFIVLEKGELLPLERDDVYKEIGCIKPAKISIPLESRGASPIQISPPQDTSFSYDIEERRIGIQERIAKLNEEPAPQVKIEPEIRIEVGCFAPNKIYYLPENNLPICLSEDVAKEAFAELKTEIKECRGGKEKFNTYCLDHDQAEKVFRNLHELPKKGIEFDYLSFTNCPDGQFFTENGCMVIAKQEAENGRCPDGYEYDKDEFMCISERVAEAKKLKQIEKERSAEGSIDQIQSCSLGVDRCAPSIVLRNRETNQPYYFKEKCIYDNVNKISYFTLFDGYYVDDVCKEKLPEPKVTYFRNERAMNRYLLEKTGFKGKELEIEGLRSRAISSILKEKEIKKRFESILPAAPLDRKINQDITLGEAVEKFAKENSVPPALFLGLIKTESDFDESAKSSKQARGLGQLTKIAVDELNRVNKEKQFNFDEVINNPLVNLDASASYLNYLAKRLNTNVCDSRVWAAYNTGLGNLNAVCCGNVNCKCTKNYWSFKNNLPEETQKHVTRIYGFSRTFAVVSNLKGC